MSYLSSPKSKFLRVKCKECEHEMIIFNHAKTQIKCAGEKCEEILAVAQSGKAKILGEIIETLD